MTPSPAGSVLATIFDEVLIEVDRQVREHPAGFPATRDGLRLGLAAIADEAKEAHDEWEAHRKVPGWGNMDGELIQLAAVTLQMIYALRADPEA